MTTACVQPACAGCENHFPLRDLFVLSGPGKGKEMRCLACFYARICENAGDRPQLTLAEFHEMIGGPAVEPVVMVRS